MKTTWDNEESDQKKGLRKMLDNMKELIKEQEEKHANVLKVRRLSALETSEMAKVQCDNIGFQTSEDNVRIMVGSLLERDKMDNVTNDKIKGETASIMFKNQYAKVISYCFIFHFSLFLG
jgi:hypothetical protein